MSKQGYVYVLTNAAMPGLVKIGHSVNGGKTRARDIYQTGVPLPFDVAFEMLVDDSYEIEQRVHSWLSPYRVSDNREFFRCDVEDAIESVIGAYLCDSEQCVGSLEVEEIIHNSVGALANSFGAYFMEGISALQHITKEEFKVFLDRYMDHRRRILEKMQRKDPSNITDMRKEEGK